MAIWGSENQYKCYEVHMKYQAGYAQTEAWTSGKTQHGGVGWFHPFGPSRYYCGTEFAEAKDYPLEQYFSEYWQKTYDTSLFCVYHLEDGDIYAWDGIFAVRGKTGDMEVPLDTEGEHRDILVNVIVGGSGAYTGAYGLMMGTAEGAGNVGIAANGSLLPEALIKDLRGYIKIPVGTGTESAG